MRPLSNSFTDRQDAYDKLLVKEKKRIQKVKKQSFWIEIGILLSLCVICAVLRYNQYLEYERFALIYAIFDFIFNVLTGLALVGCAFFLTRSIRTLIGKKSNTCLLGWHALNIAIVAFSNFIWFYQVDEYVEAKANGDGSTCSKLQIKIASKETKIAWYVAFAVTKYMDMFLLYLLIRFSRQIKI